MPGCILFASALSQIVAPSGGRRALALTLAALALVVPWFAPEGTVLRAGVALYLLWTFAKVVDMARDGEPRPALFRWIWMLVLHDLRRDGYARSGPHAELRPRLLLSASVNLCVALACLHVAVFEATAIDSWAARWFARQGAGILVCYFGVEGCLRTFEFFDRCFGLRPPPLHDHPILSRSLAEFWGRRWNRVVGHWLFATFYRPLALRQHPGLALAASFGASALVHLYFTAAAIGFGWSLIMASFFLLQIPLLWLEARLDQRRWPEALRRLWTVACLTLTSPLFVMPTLLTLEGGFS
jgi:hypothetical protein